MVSFYMYYVYRALLVVAVIALLISGYVYFFASEHIDFIKLQFDAEAKELQMIDAAQELSRQGDTETANGVFLQLIDGAKSDIVYERALREYGRNVGADDPQIALEYTLKMATDARVRADVRAGALESLAEMYMYEGGISKEDLTATIFALEPLITVRAQANSNISEVQVLLEYANQISLQPLTTAYLLHLYAKQWQEGDASAQARFTDSLKQFESLISEVPETSPDRAQALGLVAGSLVYAHDANPSYEGTQPDVALTTAIEASAPIFALFAPFAQELQTQYKEFNIYNKKFAPLEQYRVALTSVSTVKPTSATYNIVEQYRVFKDTNMQDGPTPDFQSLQQLEESLLAKYPLTEATSTVGVLE